VERIDKDTWRTDNGDDVRTRGLRLTVEFGEKTKAKVLCAVEAVRAENDKLRELVSLMDERDVLLPCMFGCNANCRFYSGDMCKRIGSLMRELGIEVE
jgi:hypothetical protein